MAPKFCKDCKFSHDRGDGELRCAAPQNFVEVVDRAQWLVTGVAQPTKKAVRGGTAKSLREERPAGIAELVCGPEGKWFQPKAKQTGVVGVMVSGEVVGGKAG